MVSGSECAIITGHNHAQGRRVKHPENEGLEDDGDEPA
jgi:hypothetical protein